MKRLLLIIVLLLASYAAKAQMVVAGDTLYGNEWVVPAQNYLKIKIYLNGFYRLTYPTLSQVAQAAGVSLSGVTGDNLQLFHLGQEVPIYVNNNGILGSNDYIDFYAKANLGELDQYLYERPEWTTNPYASVITDTAAYFLTWNTGSNHKRFVITNNDLSNPPVPDNYYMQEDLLEYRNSFNAGRSYIINGTNDVLYTSSFDDGEGYHSGYDVIRNNNFTLTNIYSGSANVNASVEVGVITAGVVAHNATFLVNNNPIGNVIQPGWSTRVRSFDFAPTLLQASTNIGIVDNQNFAVSYVKLRYPRTFNFNNQTKFKFKVNNGPSTHYLVISNFNNVASLGTPILYDLTNNIRITTFLDNGNNTVKVVLPPGSDPLGVSDRELLLINDSQASIINANDVSSVQFVDFNALNGDYLIVSHKHFINAVGSPVQAYANYRATTGKVPVIIDIQQAYDQFAYGVNRHPLSLRNLAAFAQRNWTGLSNNPADYMFLIGKGYGYRSSRYNPPANFYIPTYGYPESDVLLVSSAHKITPILSIGRLSAKTTQEVTDYLEKVRELELNQAGLAQTVPDRGWQKNVLHLGGGSAGAESTNIKNWLNGMRDTIEAPRYGANVKSFFKTSTDPIQVAQSDQLDSLIDAGVSIITFFGHSSQNSFEFNLDQPQNYNNFGRTPLIISLGCFSGNIFYPNQTVSEQFVLTPQKGATAFMASSFESLDQFLAQYATSFYDKLGNTGTYGSSLGALMRETNAYNESNPSVNFRMILQQMILHGDPALKLNTHAGPDYVVNENSARVSPSFITTRLDSFDLDLRMWNIGSASYSTYEVSIMRTFPDGTQLNAIQPFRVGAPYWDSTAQVRIPVGGDLALGLNRFHVKIDNLEEVAELPAGAAEQNNEIDFELYIFSEDIIPVYPEDFSIVPTIPILKASTANVLAPDRNYIIEIDTTEYFNSPIVQRYDIQQAGGLVEWQPSMPWMDSTVYYWRVGVDSTSPTEPHRWRGRSFIYLPGSSLGWNQSHYYQYKKDAYRNMRMEPSRRFEFVDNFQSLSCETGYAGVALTSRINAYLNNSRINGCSGSCANLGGFYVVVLDGNTLEPLPNQFDGQYGSSTCQNFQESGFFFETTNQQARLNMYFFLNNNAVVKPGDYVMIYSLNDYRPQDFILDQPLISTTLTDYFQSQGATQISTAASRPYAFFYRKDTPGFAQEKLAASSADILNASFDIQGNWTNGNVRSTIIGPASAWTDFHVRTNRYDNFATDTFNVNLYGINSVGAETLIYRFNQTTKDSTLTQLSAAQYPYLRLRYNSRDDAYGSSRQIHYWRINYQGLPELALRPETSFTFVGDSLQQADLMRFNILVENISDLPMSDSVLVKYAIIGRPDKTILRRYRALQPGESFTASVEMDTRDLSGNQQFLIEVNPDDDQPELYHFNNLAVKQFNVLGDRINPLLDVTFDGIHILDNDLVSAKPEILITMKDENRFLGLSDDNLFQIYLVDPNGVTQRIQFSDPILQFIPASDADANNGRNKAKIIINPTFLLDGTYALLVRGRDRSNNDSGDLSFKVNFKVINESSVSNVFPYPNPFTTSTKFVFTLTGSTVPDYMKIQIMTITGKVVREITQEELGSLHIGNNISEYTWDGTDEFGDRLANGVYLYRVITRQNGEEMKKYDTRTNQYFQGGVGKLYIMR